MRRDPELIRKIILAIEASPTGGAPDELKIEGDYTVEQIGYHSYLVADQGLAVGTDVADLGDDGPVVKLLWLTSAGHDFADAARNETLWRTTLARVRGTVETVTIGVLTAVLSEEARRQLLGG